MPQPTPEMTPTENRRGPARSLAAHIDIGTILMGFLGFVLVFLVNRGIANLDNLAQEVAQLNAKMAVVIASAAHQERRDNVQDERIKEIEAILGKPFRERNKE